MAMTLVIVEKSNKDAKCYSFHEKSVIIVTDEALTGSLGFVTFSIVYSAGLVRIKHYISREGAQT